MSKDGRVADTATSNPRKLDSVLRSADSNLMGFLMHFRDRVLELNATERDDLNGLCEDMIGDLRRLQSCIYPPANVLFVPSERWRQGRRRRRG